ncbi:arylsulfatase [Maribacter sp. MAR_2009_72]|uniref:arylsulfatase n=1 Tax=Maribacter sp. MAR_2009_72 TaxID=1250050 RepID=UPI00119AA239|nr:arylsulfatase [Maribacter sp. MAR_2009_72]TVZ14692.1 arylsulfatase [Maribacter sp. MAR_2009_72]
MRNLFLGLFIALSFLSCNEEKKSEAPTEQKPNIIYILADDLGYAEIGVFGQEKIETPHIDALAKQGMIFTQHYSSAPVCAPARYMFLTGKHSGKAFIRGNDEWNERGDVWNYKAMAKDSTLEGQRPVPQGTKTIASYLKDVGYKTALVGKWGLGAPHTHSIPNEMGFDFFYGFNCQRQAHTYYPLHLYKNRNRVHLANDTVAPSSPFPKGLDPMNLENYKDYTLTDYAPDLMFQELTGFIAQNKDHPFFLYWATPIPHVALQAPQRWVDYYIEKFGEEEPYLSGNGNGYFSHRTPHAAYAAMVSYFDENVGKLVQQLKDENIYENTLIVFTSDNGPSYAGGADPQFFDSAKPFKGGYGRGKGFVYEGGIRVPTFFTWLGKINPGTTSDHVSAHYDMLATFADITDFEIKHETNGISLLPTLLGQQNQEQHNFLYWEFPEYGGQIAIRMGKWKVVRQHIKDDMPPTLELYDLNVDALEQHNIASKHPEILQKADSIFKIEHTMPTTVRFQIPLLVNGLLSQ